MIFTVASGSSEVRKIDINMKLDINIILTEWPTVAHTRVDQHLGWNAVMPRTESAKSDAARPIEIWRGRYQRQASGSSTGVATGTKRRNRYRPDGPARPGAE